MMENTQKPAIRFKGFAEAWEQRKFEEIAVRSSVICSDDTLPRVEYEDIVSGTGRLNKDIYAKQSSKSGIAFHQGDVLYGKLRPYLQNWLLPTFDGLAVGDFWVLQPQNADSNFLYRLIQSRQFDEVANQSTGTKMPRADWKLVSKTVFSIPSNISEQAAIGTYFTALDSLITLHQRKCDRLQNVKKSMLEKMFPKNGSAVPEIRFKGFTEAWEQRKLGEMYDRVSEKNDLSYTKEQIISVANMYFKPDSYITDEEYLRTYNVFLLGDIAFEGNKSKNYAHGRFVENTIGNGIVSHVFDVFRPKIDFDLLYWKYAINNERIMGDLLVRCTKASTMMTNLVAADFLKESLLVPSVEEQKKIGQYLTQLDNLITLHQRKLEKLKNIKKSMLEKMFV
jgi:type I restriction enzyme S subunit